MRSLKPLKARLPLTDCWPTHATICAMLMGLPLLPHWLMMSGLLWRCSVSMHTWGWGSGGRSREWGEAGGQEGSRAVGQAGQGRQQEHEGEAGGQVT